MIKCLFDLTDPLNPLCLSDRQPVPGEHQRVLVKSVSQRRHLRGRRGQLHLPVRAALQRAHLCRGAHALFAQPLLQPRPMRPHARLPGLPVQLPDWVARYAPVIQSSHAYPCQSLTKRSDSDSLRVSVYSLFLDKCSDLLPKVSTSKRLQVTETLYVSALVLWTNESSCSD